VRKTKAQRSRDGSLLIIWRCREKGGSTFGRAGTTERKSGGRRSAISRETIQWRVPAAEFQRKKSKKETVASPVAPENEGGPPAFPGSYSALVQRKRGRAWGLKPSGSRQKEAFERMQRTERGDSERKQKKQGRGGGSRQKKKAWGGVEEVGLR